MKCCGASSKIDVAKKKIAAVAHLHLILAQQSLFFRNVDSHMKFRRLASWRKCIEHQMRHTWSADTFIPPWVNLSERSIREHVQFRDSHHSVVVLRGGDVRFRHVHALSV